MSRQVQTPSKPEEFWFNNFRELYNGNNYNKIFVKKNMTTEECFNSITRCIILVAIILLIIIGSINIIGLLFVILVMIIVIYYLLQYSRILDEPFDPKSKSSNNSDNNIINNIAMNAGNEINQDTYTIIPTNNLVNNLCTNLSCNNDDTHSIARSLYGYRSLDEINSIYNFPDLQSNINNCGFNPSNVSEDKLNNGFNEKELAKFHSDLFETVDNIYEKKNHERQFNTTQNRTNPTNEANARKWIYATPITCKEISGQCFRYDDLVRDRDTIISP